MLPSVRAFLSGIIDYAGLFPPAQLPLNQAISLYARYRTEPDSWMLGRFVCPVQRAGAICSPRWRVAEGADMFSVVANTGERTAIRSFSGISRFSRTRARQRRQIRRSPAGHPLADCQTQLARSTRNSGTMNLEAGIPALTTFYGPNLMRRTFRNGRPGGATRSRPPTRIQTPLRRSKRFHISQHHRRSRDCVLPTQPPLKFTVAIPSHRHYDAGLETHMHGFLNVFGAGILAHARKLSEKQIAEIIADEDAGHFVFTEDGFRWNEKLFASVAEITTARQEAVISFGSCSFDDPRDDLRKLGLL